MNQRTPLYHQIYLVLKQDIEDGKFDPKEPLPNQVELAKQFEVSEITMRRALTELANDGLILRSRGKGTFVNKNIGESSNGRKGIRPYTLKQIYLAFPINHLLSLNQRFQSDLIAGIDDFCQQHNIRFRFWEIDKNGKLPEEADTGIVLMPHLQMSIKQLAEWKEAIDRLITVHIYYPHLQIPYVISDNLTGGYTATQHLIGLGHQRIGIILTGNSHLDLNQDFSLRLQGYRLALDQNRIEFDESLVCVVQGYQELEEMGKEGIRQLFNLEHPPTAIFATSDYKAFGCIKELGEKGLRVPEDVSIIGYDDVLASKYLAPGLTTIDQNAYQMGWRASEILTFDWEKGKNKEQYKDEIVPKLVIRESTTSFNS